MPSKRITTATHGLGETRTQLFIRKGGYSSARQTIQKGARRSYLQSGRPLCCFYCGYSLHVDIAHKRGVMQFPGTTLVDEINDPENLIALCPNHHREADAGTLDLMAARGIELHFGSHGFLKPPHHQRRRTYQQGSLALKPRRLGPDVWVLRYMDGDKQRAMIIGDQERFPTKEAANQAADSLRSVMWKQFPRKPGKQFNRAECSLTPFQSVNPNEEITLNE